MNKNWDEALALIFESPTWVIDRFIGGKGVTLISGSPGSMKSLMALDMALHLVDVEGALQPNPEQPHTWRGMAMERWNEDGEEYRVLLAAEEAHESEVYGRMAALIKKAGHGPELFNLLLSRLFISHQHPPDLHLGKGLLPALLGEAEQELGARPNLVIVDSMPSLSSADDENSATQLQKVTQELRDTAGNHKVPVVAICHPSQESARYIRDGLSKGNPPSVEAAVRGSSRISANVDTIVSVAVDPADGDWSNSMLVKTRHSQKDNDVWQVKREPTDVSGHDPSGREASMSWPVLSMVRQMSNEVIETARKVTNQELVANALREKAPGRWLRLSDYEKLIRPHFENLASKDTVGRWVRNNDAEARAQGIEWQWVPSGKTKAIEIKAGDDPAPDEPFEEPEMGVEVPAEELSPAEKLAERLNGEAGV